MVNQSKSILAKLLANENIDVQYGNYSTAFFDVQNRVLGLPLWKQTSQNLTDLLIGHEVGHALYTPAEGWHDASVDIPGCPRSYVNVVEDIRIEKKIQRKYPGLVRCFKLGYKDLFDRNFFGTKDRSIESYCLIDRINIKAKLRDLIEVPFSSEEQPLVDMAMSVETWEDVIAACSALYDYMKENGQEKKSNEADNQMDASADEGFENEVSDDASSNSGEESGEENETSERMGSGNSAEKSEELKKDQGSGQSTVDTQDPEGGDVAGNKSPKTVETDNAFRSNEQDLIESDEQGNQPLYVKSLTRQQYEDMLFTYADVEKSRTVYAMYNMDFPEDEYQSFVNETKRTTGVMAKEFEMRKAAFRSARAQTARSGSLDVNKLYSYKYNDDIFKKVTTLADAKSHGMIMVIDFSGSMDSILGPTIKQTLNLATFCKKVSIPFEVYGFTSGGNGGRDRKRFNTNGSIETDDVRMFELLSSSMKKDKYEDAYRKLFKRSTMSAWENFSSVEITGGTPLNEVLLGLDYTIADFKKKFPVQKVNLVLLTDGAGRNIRVMADREQTYSREMILEKNGKLIKASRRYGDTNLTGVLLEQIQKSVTTIGFFLAARAYDFNGAIWASSESYVSTEDLKELRREYNKQKFVSMDSAKGYDRFFIVKADRKSLDTDNDDLEIDVDMSKAKIKSAFMKFQKSKKGNRVLATKFAEIVA